MLPYLHTVKVNERGSDREKWDLKHVWPLCSLLSSCCMGFPAAVSVGGLCPEPAEASCSVSTEAGCPRGWLGRQRGCSRGGSGWDQAISQPCSLAHRATFGCHGTSPCPVGWPIPRGQNPPLTIACQYHARFTDRGCRAPQHIPGGERKLKRS